MSVFKRGNTYWYSFQWRGQHIQKSTKQGNDKVADRMQAEEKAGLERDYQDRQAKAKKLGCLPEELITCARCEILFPASVAVASNGFKFCSDPCAEEWVRQRFQAPLLRDFTQRFLDNC